MVDDKEIKIRLKKILCSDCKHFEDTGIKDIIRYDKRCRVIKERIQVRFYCKAYREYLTKFYSMCKRYDSVYENE